ncbi:MAG: hypothetical protein HY078_17365 [Elusimicrobia bacterium]|nr:hypothetical protein [Elusimicrobiota bacterium]
MNGLLLALLLAAAGAEASAPQLDPLKAGFEQALRRVETILEDDREFLPGFEPRCTRASASQIATVDRGNALRERYLNACADAGAEAVWCAQSLRPNPDSRSTFECTYGPSQPHQLIHPDPSTWPHAFGALRLVSELVEGGLRVCLINNWWRPEPYNENVGGAAGRHPFGTAVDVKFCTMDDKERAFDELCRLRAQGRLKALGYYPGSTVLHLGVGDRVGNTWGKACP